MFVSHTVTFVKTVMSGVLGPGDVAVDATVGNGHDTVFLAGLVGSSGHVHGFDIQQSALNNAEARFVEAGCDHCVTLHLAGHERMADILPEPVCGSVAAVMFNLGYLPGSDGSVITVPETSLLAIDAGLSIMRRGGIMSLVLYTGHPGGSEEAEAVEAHCAALDPEHARVMRCAMHNQPSSQVRVLFVEKR